MLRLSIFFIILTIPFFSLSQLRIEAFDNQPTRYFLTKNGKEKEITKEQVDKIYPPEKETKKINSDERFDYTPYGYTKDEYEYNFKVSSLNTLTHNEYITQMSYCDFDEVQRRIMGYAQSILNWQVLGVDKIKGTNSWVQKYANTGVFTDKVKRGNVRIRYNIFTNENGNDIIKDITFTGNWDMLVSFYVRYWDTNLHLTRDMKTICQNSFWQDKITLSIIDQNGNGTIKIINTTIKDEQDYSSCLNKNILNKPQINKSKKDTLNLKKEPVDSALIKKRAYDSLFKWLE